MKLLDEITIHVRDGYTMVTPQTEMYLVPQVLPINTTDSIYIKHTGVLDMYSHLITEDWTLHK